VDAYEPALLSANCALPAARRDGPGVAGFVREQRPAVGTSTLISWLLRVESDNTGDGLGVSIWRLQAAVFAVTLAASATILAGELPVTRQAVAKHLAVLDRAGLVEATRRGREVRYAIRPQRLGAATRSMAQVAADWDARLSAIKRIAESVARAQATARQNTGGKR
jgi:DNA-binding transcriptional ArsR family regulator